MIRKGLVNPLFVALALILAGCGFQLREPGRNLPFQARHMAIKLVENQTFAAGGSERLLELLKSEARKKNLNLVTPSRADLLLQVGLKRAELRSLEGQDQSLEQERFQYLAQASLTLIDQRDKQTHLEEEPQSATALTSTDRGALSRPEEDELKEEALAKLSRQILRRVQRLF